MTTDEEISGHQVTIRRRIEAPRAAVFAAWTEPAQFARWFGPRGVVCIEAELDVRIGGTYRIGNQLPDASLVWITGTYLDVVPPDLLRYTWLVGSADEEAEPSIVEVRFLANDGGTDVEVTHRRIANAEVREGHHRGWIGCLDRLAEELAPDRPAAT